MSIREYLGIKDKTFDMVASYGAPSVNLGDQTSNYLMNGGWSPIQQWEMWLRKPEPQVVVVDFSLSNFIKSFLDVLATPAVAKPLSKFIQQGVTSNVKKG